MITDTQSIFNAGVAGHGTARKGHVNIYSFNVQSHYDEQKIGSHLDGSEDSASVTWKEEWARMFKSSELCIVFGGPKYWDKAETSKALQFEQSNTGLDVIRTEMLSTYRKSGDLKYTFIQHRTPCLFEMPPRCLRISALLTASVRKHSTPGAT